MTVPYSRYLDLVKVLIRPVLSMAILLSNVNAPWQAQCRIFSHTFNPGHLRLGNKVLRQRLRGPALVSWYPKKTVSLKDLKNEIRPLGLTTFDEDEDEREEGIQMYVACAPCLESYILGANGFPRPEPNYEERAGQRKRGRQKVR